MHEAKDSDRSSAPGPTSGQELRSTIKLLLVPAALLAAALVLRVAIPWWLSRALIAGFGVFLLARSLSRPEVLLAACILYMPLSKLYPFSIAPGLNGINGMMGFLLLASWVNAARAGRPTFVRMRNSRLVAVWACFSCLSAITAVLRFGLGFILRDRLVDFAAWIDQFIVFFAFLSLIRDGSMAKRLVVYMILGYVLVMLLGVRELLDKSGYGSIEKSRLFGPQRQPNEFGAFLVYGAAPLIAYLLHHLLELRGWLLAPLLLATVKLLLATFSRGSYLGLAVAGLVGGYVRGKRYLALGGLVAVAVFVAAPEVLPSSLVDRLSQTKVEEGPADQLDRSSETRLILWKAGVDVTLDHPFLGTGFRTFPRVKGDYTERHVDEGDNHNMYLYISSQMGIPALFVFVLLLYRMYATSVKLYRQSDDSTARFIALGGVVMVAGVAGVNVFGSRMTGIDVSGNVWVYLAILAHLWAEHERRHPAPRLPSPLGARGIAQQAGGQLA